MQAIAIALSNKLLSLTWVLCLYQCSWNMEQQANFASKFSVPSEYGYNHVRQYITTFFIVLSHIWEFLKKKLNIITTKLHLLMKVWLPIKLSTLVSICTFYREKIGNKYRSVRKFTMDLNIESDLHFQWCKQTSSSTMICFKEIIERLWCLITWDICTLLVKMKRTF